MNKLLTPILLSLLLYSPFVFCQTELPDEEAIATEMDRIVDESVGISEKDQKKAEKYIKKGIKYHDKGKFERAIKQYRKAIERDPLNSVAYYEMSMSQYDARDLVGSFENAVRAIVLNPTYEDPYIMKASALDDMGYPELALKEYERLIEINPKSYMAWLNKGITQIKMEMWSEAEKSMLAANEINDRHPSAYFYLMYVNSVRGFNYDEEKYAREFLKVGGRDPRRQPVEERLKELTATTVSIPAGREPTQLLLLTGLERSLWRKEKHREAYPEERGYRPSLKEERAIADLVLAVAEEGELELTDSDKRLVKNIEELVSLGFLDADSYIRLEEHLGANDLKWGKENKQLIDRYREWNSSRPKESDG